MKIIVDKDLCDTNSNSALHNLMIHVYFFFLNYIKH
jgi:hypothetical protein